MSTRNRAIVFFTFAVLIATIEVSGQTARTTPIQPVSATEKSRVLRRFSPELQQHTAVLQRTISRYLASGDSFTPYLSSMQFWLEIRKSRTQPSRSVGRSQQERQVLWSAYTELEQDVLELMLADQIGIYQDGLELNEIQSERIHSILRADANRKLRLAAGNLTTDKNLFQRLTTMSTETEAAIRKLLSPEQQRLYEAPDRALNDLDRITWGFGISDLGFRIQ